MADRCMQCHSDISVQLTDPGTLHGAMAKVSGESNCIACHSEHHGSLSQLTSTSMQDFPHATLGFSLTTHTRRKTDNKAFVCADCHPSGYTSYNCDMCHRLIDSSFMRDHVSQYGNDCLACHDGIETVGAGFDHSKTQFLLVGRHLNLLCSGCHQDARSLADMRSTPTACINCHSKDDPHAGRFSEDCAACHNPDAWTPAKFDHNLARFKLIGKHANVACETCHKNGQFAGTPMDCASCHLPQNPHGDVFGTDCGLCHNPNGWDQVSFDHAQTGFVLDGAHTLPECKQCHGTTPAAQMSSTCGACHAKDDPHQGQLGQNCGSCHNTTAWKPSTFNHALSAFPLTGAHATVACATCHVNGQYAGIPTNCGSCHAKDDKHAGALGSNCSTCHTTTAWKPSTFDHSRSSFPLTGAHTTTICASCHVNGQFAGTPSTCGACHAKDDRHAGSLGTNCGACHSTTAWKPSTFNHSRSNFPLTGAHTNVACTSCHTNGRFAGTPSSCGACHSKNDPHGGSLGTNCGACHSTSAWKPATFDHSRSSFPLTGAHTTAACTSCHINGQFSGTPSSCGTCHAKDDSHGGQFGTKCGSCHTTTAWKPATFDHSLSGFPLTGAHSGLACSNCHANGQFSGLSSSCVSCHSEPAYHQGMFGTQCASCHNTTNWSAKYTGPHPTIDGRNGTDHHGASCRDCHTTSLSSATCLKCHDSNNPGDGGGD